MGFSQREPLNHGDVGWLNQKRNNNDTTTGSSNLLRRQLGKTNGSAFLRSIFLVKNTAHPDIDWRLSNHRPAGEAVSPVVRPLSPRAAPPARFAPQLATHTRDPLRAPAAVLQQRHRIPERVPVR